MFALIRALHDHRARRGPGPVRKPRRPHQHRDRRDGGVPLHPAGAARAGDAAGAAGRAARRSRPDRGARPRAADRRISACRRRATAGRRAEQTVRELLARTAQSSAPSCEPPPSSTRLSSATGPVTTGIVAGPLAPLPGFVDAIAAASGLELRCGEVTVAGAGALRDLDARLAPLASGLAVGELGR